MAYLVEQGSFDTECKDRRTYCRQVSTDWIELTQTLDILPFANIYSGDEDTDDDFPSWAINWDLPMPTIWAKAFPHRTNIIPYDEPRRTRLRRCLDFLCDDCLEDRTRCIERYDGATPGTLPSWAFYDQGKSLAVSGVILTQITSHFKPPQEIRRQDIRQLFSVRLDGCSIGSKAQRKRSGVSSRAFVRSAWGGKRGIYFLPWLRRKLYTSKLMKAVLLCRILLRLRHGIPVEGSEKEWVLDFFMDDKRLCALGKSHAGILRDEKLSIVCCEANSMCPGGLAYAGRGAQEGDTVALVSGVSYPLVLRPTDEKGFRLIGPLFLPGVMDGELKEVLKPELFHKIVLV